MVNFVGIDGRCMDIIDGEFAYQVVWMPSLSKTHEGCLVMRKYNNKPDNECIVWEAKGYVYGK